MREKKTAVPHPSGGGVDRALMIMHAQPPSTRTHKHKDRKRQKLCQNLLDAQRKV